jgi:hypothetical protein
MLMGGAENPSTAAAVNKSEMLEAKLTMTSIVAYEGTRM